MRAYDAKLETSHARVRSLVERGHHKLGFGITRHRHEECGTREARAFVRHRTS